MQPDLKSDDEEHPGRRKRKGRASDAGLVQEGRKRPRIAESEESNHSLPPPLSVAASRRDAGHDAHFHPPRSAIGKDLEDPPAAEIDSPAQADGPLQDGVTFGLRSPTHSSEGGTPAPFVARQAAPKGEEDAEDFFAPYRNIVPVEPQSRERLPGQVKLYTGQIFDSRDEFVDAVLRHTEERNPGCRLAVANTDPARVRVYCMRADCPYSFNSVYEHGARRVPAVKVTAVGVQAFSITHQLTNSLLPEPESSGSQC